MNGWINSLLCDGLQCYINKNGYVKNICFNQNINFLGGE